MKNNKDDDTNDGMRRLIVSIIAQAFDDLLDPLINKEEKEYSYSFLIDKTGYGARWRRHLCGLINLDEEYISNAAEKLITGDIELAAKDGRKRRVVLVSKINSSE